MTYVRLRLDIAQILAEFCDDLDLESEEQRAVNILRTEILHALGVSPSGVSAG
jgi:hypothetical protein